MRSRAFNKRIEIWDSIVVSDGFSGNTVNDYLVTSTWAKITTFNPGSRNNLTTDFGILNTQNAIVIVLRKRNDITFNTATQFVKYRGNKYTISTDPTNVNFEDSYIQFIGQRQEIAVVGEQSDLEKNAAIAPKYSARVIADDGIVEAYDCLVLAVKDITG